MSSQSHKEFVAINVNELLKDGTITDTSNPYEQKIQNFKSKQNLDVEDFLKCNALNFCRKKQAITYFVIDSYSYDDYPDILAYFTLALKTMNLNKEYIKSKTLIKKLERYGNYFGNSLQIPSVLLAQWSKNYSLNNINSIISGIDMMRLIEQEFLYIQNKIGGSFLSLECEAEKDRLIKYYKDEVKFTQVGERESNNHKPLLQFLKQL